jgi:hypothetical protein
MTSLALQAAQEPGYGERLQRARWNTGLDGQDSALVIFIRGGYIIRLEDELFIELEKNPGWDAR